MQNYHSIYMSSLPVRAGYGHSPSQKSYRKQICIRKLVLLKVFLKLGSHDQSSVSRDRKVALVWIEERQTAGYSLSESITCEKFRDKSLDFIKNNPSTNDNGETVRASKVWFCNFKARTGFIA